MHAQEGAQGERGSADDYRADHAPKKRGDLTATLNPLLEPRLSPGQPGRRRGVSNYEWTPETDRLLLELCTKWGAAKAKHIIGRRLQEGLLSDRKSTRLNSSHLGISYAVFCLKKKT